jgi:threonine dehydrogenase-like Zn-dependent dehydrogenase
VEEGQYVAMEEYSPCYHCEYCLMGEYRRCFEMFTVKNPNNTFYGSTPITRAPSLWGGFSQYMYLNMNVAFQKMPRTIRPEIAALMLPLSNGVQWSVKEPQTGPGKTILIQGPGPKGLGGVLAAHIFGAEKIIISGLAADARRLDVAKVLGADHTIIADKEDLVEKVMEFTNGEGVDGTVDATTSDSPCFLDESATSEFLRTIGFVSGAGASSIVIAMLSSQKSPDREAIYVKDGPKYLNVSCVASVAVAMIESLT